MRKLKEVLRLFSLGLKQQQIARSCRIALIGVKYFSRLRTTIFPFCFDKGKQ